MPEPMITARATSRRPPGPWAAVHRVLKRARETSEDQLRRILALERRPETANGVGIKNALIDIAGELVLMLTDGTTVAVGRVQGRDGRDIDRAAVAAEIGAQFSGEMAALRLDIAAVRAAATESAAMVTDKVAAAIASMPKPKDGEPGKSVTLSDLAPLIASEVAAVVSALPAAKDGVGIADMLVNAEGRLSVVLSDARRVDAGPVVPAPVAGPPGRSISSASVRDGRLMLMFSDGTEIDAGHVEGKPGDCVAGDPGRGIAKLELRGTDLHVVYTDGTAANLGRVAGKDGNPGKPSLAGPIIAIGNEEEPGLAADDLSQLRLVELSIGERTIHVLTLE